MIDTLKALSNEETEIYIGYEERRLDSESIFYTLADRNFEYEKVDLLPFIDPFTPVSYSFYWD